MVCIVSIHACQAGGIDSHTTGCIVGVLRCKTGFRIGEGTLVTGEQLLCSVLKDLEDQRPSRVEPSRLSFYSSRPWLGHLDVWCGMCTCSVGCVIVNQSMACCTINPPPTAGSGNAKQMKNERTTFICVME